VKNIGLIVLLVILVQGSMVSASSDSDSAGEILSLLKAQVEAWNRGDFEGFMAYYWESPDMTFKDLETEILSEDIAYVLGRYHLEYPEVTREGLFTIIFKRFPQGWRIIHDHSSSGPTE
jgi:beta-aspartyl-peptidase (threonine type)